MEIKRESLHRATITTTFGEESPGEDIIPAAWMLDVGDQLCDEGHDVDVVGRWIPPGLGFDRWALRNLDKEMQRLGRAVANPLGQIEVRTDRDLVNKMLLVIRLYWTAQVFVALEDDEL